MNDANASECLVHPRELRHQVPMELDVTCKKRHRSAWPTC